MLGSQREGGAHAGLFRYRGDADQGGPARDGGAVEPLGDTPTPAEDFAAFAGALGGFLFGRGPRGVAISIAGVVDPETGG